jgi:hypothetical protein
MKVALNTKKNQKSMIFQHMEDDTRTHALLVIGLYELLGNPTTYLIEPPGP